MLARLRGMALERTLVLIKPDGVRRGLTGEVIRRIEAKGYTLARLELRSATPELLAGHYAEHQGKPFYDPLVEFMLSGPVVAMVVEGQRCIEGFRALAGATDPTAALPGTIRATSAATGASPCSRTWCTARTHPSLPSARSGCGTPARDLRPRLPLSHGCTTRTTCPACPPGLGCSANLRSAQVPRPRR